MSSLASGLARSFTFRALSSLPLLPNPTSLFCALPRLALSPPLRSPLQTSRSPPLPPHFAPPLSFRRRGTLVLDEDDDDEDEDDEASAFDKDFDLADEDEGEQEAESLSPETPQKLSAARKFPLLSNKEKKDLRAYAHGLGKKIVSQQVGKAGVTPSLASAISDALEANEILKLRVLDNCPDELETVKEKLEATTEAQVVGKIGSTLLLYRPSLRKLEVAEKQKNKPPQSQTRRMFKSARGGRKA